MGLGIKEYIKVRKAKKLFGNFIRRGDLVFDCGANRGRYTDYFLGMGAQVICIEPEANCMSMLMEKYRHNPAVELVDKALGAEQGNQPFFPSSHTELGTFSQAYIDAMQAINPDIAWQAGVQMEMITLDSLIASKGAPAFCKIDVEGYELEVLQGLTQPLKALSFELAMPLASKGMDCIRHLAQLGTYAFNISFRENFSWESKTWLSPERMIDFIRHAVLPDVVVAEVYANRIIEI